MVLCFKRLVNSVCFISLFKVLKTMFFTLKKTSPSGRVHVRHIHRVKSPTFGFPFDLFIYLFSFFLYERKYCRVDVFTGAEFVFHANEWQRRCIVLGLILMRDCEKYVQKKPLQVCGKQNKYIYT